MRCRMQQHHHRRAHAQRGFSLPELAVVMVSGGLILGPSLTTISSIIDGMHERQNIIVLETARDALITFAGAHGGCLPFAADYEGGQPNTDQNGAPSPANPDTGIGRADSHGGDLPWAELGLGNNFLDHDGLRVQYYVASQYTDIDADSSNGINCAAGQRGTQWNSRITYDGTGEPQYVYYESPGDDQELYKIVGVLPAGTPPDGVHKSIADAVSDPLPNALLELRRGPDINGANVQSDVLSAQNVFVMIVTGTNINTSATIGLPFMRDVNHKKNQGSAPWPLNQENVDKVRFSATHEFDSSDQSNSDDDTLLVVSFNRFKRYVFKYGVSVKPLSEDIK